MDAKWNIIMRNEAAARIIAYCVTGETIRKLFPDGAVNFMELMFAREGLRAHVINWTQSRGALLQRLRREAAGNPGSPSEAMRRRLEQDAAVSDAGPTIDDDGIDPMLSLELRLGDTRLRLFNTFTTFGTPQDVALQELRIDMSFPADEATRRFLEAAASSVSMARYPNAFEFNASGRLFPVIARSNATKQSIRLPSSSAKADDPLFQRRLRRNREASAYWIPRIRGV